VPQSKLTKRNIDALRPAAVRYTMWDTYVSGFGIRVTPKGQQVYVIKYRISGQQRWYTIGRHGSPWTPEMARREAQRSLAR
jgi:Arm DNA-binding domain